jgi:hypothetical protein
MLYGSASDEPTFVQGRIKGCTSAKRAGNISWWELSSFAKRSCFVYGTNSEGGTCSWHCCSSLAIRRQPTGLSSGSIRKRLGRAPRRQGVSHGSQKGFMVSQRFATVCGDNRELSVYRDLRNLKRL